jgi:hypothetical protein
MNRILLSIIAFFAIISTVFAQSAVYNSVATAYVQTTISQNVVFDSTMQAGGTFEFDVLAHNGGGRAGQSDTANVKIQFYDSSNNLLNTVNTSYRSNLPNPNALGGNPQIDPAVPWTTLSVTSTNCGGSCSNVAYAKVSMYGIDGSYWAGDYGPWYRAPTLTLNGGNNLLYNPEFGPYNGITAQGWSTSPGFGACQGAWGGSNACIVNSSGVPGQSTTGLVANQNGGGPSLSGGTTSGAAGGYNSTMNVNNPNGGTPSAPTIVSSAPGTPSVTTTNSTGAPSTTTVTNTSTVTSTDADGHQVVTTYYTVTTTTSTPNTSTITTTPVTVNTYSDGSTQTVNGTPVTTTTTTNTDVVSTTQPALQSVATTVSVPTTNTSSGTAVTTTATTNLPSSSIDLISFSKAQSGSTVTVNKNITTITDNPFTVTTTVTTPLTTTTTVTPTTTTVDANGNVISVTYGTPTSTDNTVYQVVSSDQTFNSYTSTSVDHKKDVNVGGTQTAIDYNIVNPYIIDPMTTPDGSWANAGGSLSTNVGVSSLDFGYQTSKGNITAGIAGRAGQMASQNLQNSTVSGNSYGGTIYVLNRMDPIWVKGSIGYSITDLTTKNNIPEFGLSYTQNSEQKVAYGDLTLYSAKTFAGWRPFAGATVVNSDIGSIVESGSALLSNGMAPSNKTYTMPYVGARYDINENLSLEGRVTNTEPFGAIAGTRLVARKNLTDKVSINISAGYDHGNNYDNASIMAGLTINF